MSRNRRYGVSRGKHKKLYKDALYGSISAKRRRHRERLSVATNRQRWIDIHDQEHRTRAAAVRASGKKAKMHGFMPKLERVV